MSEFNNKSLANLLTDVRSIIESDTDLNSEKENLNAMLKQVNFLIGKYDHLYTPFAENFEAMARADFTRRVPAEADNEFIEFLSIGMNMVNEELDGMVLHKDVVNSMLEGLNINGGAVIVTDSDGYINFINSRSEDLINFNEHTLKGQRIHVIFKSFACIDEKMNSLNSIRDLDVELEWRGTVIPKKLTLAIAVKLGKIHSLVYVLKSR